MGDMNAIAVVLSGTRISSMKIVNYTTSISGLWTITLGGCSRDVSCTWEKGLHTLAELTVMTHVADWSNVVISVPYCVDITPLYELCQPLTGISTLDIDLPQVRVMPLPVSRTLTTLRLGCLMSTLPISISQMVNLTILDLHDCYSLASLPETLGWLVKLTVLNLSGCGLLKQLPDTLNRLRLLTTVNLADCSRLWSLSPIDQLPSLISLDITRCSSLSFHATMSSGLQTLVLSQCSTPSAATWAAKHVSESTTTLGLPMCISQVPVWISRLTGLTTLNLSSCSIHQLPMFLMHMTWLQKLIVAHCVKLTEIPDHIHLLTRLTLLNCRGCQALTCLPESIGRLSMLVELDVSYCVSLRHIPDSIGNLSSLSVFDGYGGLPGDVPATIKRLPLKILRVECAGKLPDMLGLWYETLCISSHQMTRMPEFAGSYFNLTALTIYRCFMLSCLPESIGLLAHLATLKIIECDVLSWLPESIGTLVKLTNLTVSKVGLVTRLPESIGQLTRLSSLYVSRCCNLQVLPTSLGSLSTLESLTVAKCNILTTMPICGLIALRHLVIRDCPMLTRLPDMGKLTLLHDVSISDTGLTMLPRSIGLLTRLRFLVLNCNADLVYPKLMNATDYQPSTSPYVDPVTGLCVSLMPIGYDHFDHCVSTTPQLFTMPWNSRYLTQLPGIMTLVLVARRRNVRHLPDEVWHVVHTMAVVPGIAEDDDVYAFTG